jgi:peptidoglycan hydrolase-like amidase
MKTNLSGLNKTVLRENDLNTASIDSKFNSNVRIFMFILIAASSSVHPVLSSSSGVFRMNSTVRVNIIGYANLDEFTIIPPEESILKINGKSVRCSNIRIFPGEVKALCDSKMTVNLGSIEIKSDGTTVLNSFAGGQEYRGDFFIGKKDGRMMILNTVGIDDYFASVLGSEMGGGFSDETLKSCAIAIRTYYYKRKRDYAREGYDINNADGIDMVYRGSAFATERMYRAFADTENLFLVDGKNSLALPLFHSTSGGVILKDIAMKSGFDDDIADPVLLTDTDGMNKPLSSDSPFFKFNCSIDEAGIIRIISPEIMTDSISCIVLKYFKGTGCVDFIGFEGNDGMIRWMKAYLFVSLCQKKGFHEIRSIQFSVEKSGNIFYFRGNGFGHLCGMSQYSAETLARKGFTYRRILKMYYPEYALKRKNVFFGTVF